MKVSSTELPPRQVALDIEVDKDRLDRAVDEAYRRVAGRVDVPGFRRGKAPRSMVERVIGRDRIVEDALDRLVPEVVTEAMQQEKVEPYTRPRVESIEFDPLRLKAVVGLAPKIELGDYKTSLRIVREEPNIGDEQVEGVIQRLRESYAQWAPVEREVATGDRVGIDLRVTVEGQDEPIIDDKDAEYVVDSERVPPAPGFPEQIVGMKPEETRTFTLSMAEDYRDKDVAGKPAQFEVTLHWVKERELPALDDEFAQQVGDYSDVAGLRSAVEAQIKQREEDRVREKLEEDAMTRLVEISTIEFPPQLVDHQAEYMLASFKNSVERQGLQLNQYLRMLGKEQEAFEQEIRTEAEARVRRSLALDAFATAEHIDGEEPTAEADADGRSTRALARLVEMATGSGLNGEVGSENAADQANTSDTEIQTPAADATMSTSEEDRGTA